jgi:hypothetical protein
MAEQSINFYTDRTLAEAEQAYAELAEKLDEAQAKWAKKIEENSKPMTLAGFDTESSSALHQNMQELAELEQMAAGLSTSSLLKTKVAEFNELAISAEQAAYVAERNIFTAEKLGNATHEAFKSMEDPLAEGIKNGDSIGDIAAAMGDALHGFAAQKTAHLLMEAAYETILAGATALIPTRAWESGAHLSAAAMYASGAALMGTFTYAMGKAHDGID